MTDRMLKCIVQFELDCCSGLRCEWMRAYERYGCQHLSDNNEEENTMKRFFRHKKWIGDQLIEERFGYKVVLQRHPYQGKVRTGSKFWIRRRWDLEKQHNPKTYQCVTTRSNESKSSGRPTRSNTDTTIEEPWVPQRPGRSSGRYTRTNQPSLLDPAPSDRNQRNQLVQIAKKVAAKAKKHLIPQLKEHLANHREKEELYKIRKKVAVAKKNEVDQMELMATALEQEQNTTAEWNGTSLGLIELAQSTVASARKRGRDIVRGSMWAFSRAFYGCSRGGIRLRNQHVELHDALFVAGASISRRNDDTAKSVLAAAAEQTLWTTMSLHDAFVYFSRFDVTVDKYRETRASMLALLMAKGTYGSPILLPPYYLLDEFIQDKICPKRNYTYGLVGPLPLTMQTVELHPTQQNTCRQLQYGKKGIIQWKAPDIMLDSHDWTNTPGVAHHFEDRLKMEFDYYYKKEDGIEDKLIESYGEEWFEDYSLSILITTGADGTLGIAGGNSKMGSKLMDCGFMVKAAFVQPIGLVEEGYCCFGKNE